MDNESYLALCDLLKQEALTLGGEIRAFHATSDPKKKIGCTRRAEAARKRIDNIAVKMILARMGERNLLGISGGASPVDGEGGAQAAEQGDLDHG